MADGRKINEIVSLILADEEVTADADSMTFLGQDPRSREEKIKDAVVAYAASERDKYINIMCHAPHIIFHKTLSYIHNYGIMGK